MKVKGFIPHGTAGGYTNHSCRCDLCRMANAEAARTARARARIAPDDPRHGTVNGYANYMCRCGPCCAAKAAYARAARGRAS